MKLKIILCLLILLRALPSWSCQHDTIRVFYNINRSALSSQNKVTLDSLGYFISDTTAVHVLGYADYLGKRNPNYTLSKARAATVRAYLTNLHRKNVRMVADGKGQVDAATKSLSSLGEPFNRRVDIIVTKAVPVNKISAKPAPVDKIEVKTKPADKVEARAKPVDKIEAKAKPAEKVEAKAKPVDKLAAFYLKSAPVKKKDDSVYMRINDLPKLNVGDSVSFKELIFLPGRHFLRRTAIPYMVALKNCLKDNPNLKIEIQGHICCQNDNKDGLDFDTKKNNLSVNRAKFIYDYLVSEGIVPQRLRYKGLGSREPKVYPELSADDQDQNRRVVIVLTGK